MSRSQTLSSESTDFEALMQLRADLIEVISGHNGTGTPAPAYDTWANTLRERVAHKAIETGIATKRMRALVDSFRAAGLVGLATEYERQQLLDLLEGGGDLDRDGEIVQ